MNNPVAELAAATIADLKLAEERFNQAADDDLIDAAILEHRAVMLRLNDLFRQAKKIWKGESPWQDRDWKGRLLGIGQKWTKRYGRSAR